MTYFQIGSLAFPAVWLAVLSALFIASLIYRFLTSHKVGDWYWNGFFLYFLTWKLSYILLNLNMFVKMPLSFIYFNGGTKGHFLALTLLSLYLLFYIGKKNPGIYNALSHIFLLFFISYEVIILLLESNWFAAFTQFIVLASYLFLVNYLKKGDKLIPSTLMIVWILMELLVLSIFNTMFSLETLTFIWIGLTILVLFKKVDTEVHNT